MRALIIVAALMPILTGVGPVLAAAENAPQKPKPLAAPLLNQPFGGVSINRGFTDRHFELRGKADELPRKVDTKKKQPAPRPVDVPGKVMRWA